MSVEAVTLHLNYVIGEIKSHLGDLIGSGFYFVHVDSYEAGEPTWTLKMREEFAARRGYDLTPYLATFANRVIGSEKETAKFKADFKATVEDLYRDVHFALTSKRLKEVGLDFCCEPYGGPWRYEEVMPYVDNLMTEFWSSGAKPVVIKAFRASGRNIIGAEAFTGWPKDSTWSETPAWLKPVGDAAFCEGINRFIIHRFVQQPWDDRYKPGNTMGGWGTHFDRTQTWWEPGKAMVQYWQRCQALLQWGKRQDVPVDFEVNQASSGLKLRSIHRRGEQAEVYFVVNTAAAVGGMATCSFAGGDHQPELWDAVWGTRRDLPEFERRDGRTLIPLQFAPGQSWFVVFRKKTEAKSLGAGKNFPEVKLVTELAGPWAVAFDPKWGPFTAASGKRPGEFVFEKLEDWTQRPEAAIKYYSGTATYRTAFQVAESRARLYLDLGTVKHIARVWLNGRHLGVVWCAPWRVALPPGSVKAGTNRVEIEITNTWANRLIGDEQEPADCEFVRSFGDSKPLGPIADYYLKTFPDWFVKNQQRHSKGRYCFTTWNYFTKNSPLHPAGLIGPVTIRIAE